MQKPITFLKQAFSITAINCVKLLRFLPLPMIHILGAIAGVLYFLFNYKHRMLTKNNLAQSGLVSTAWAMQKLVFKNAIESSKVAFETFAIWFKPQQNVLAWVKEINGWEHIEAGLQAGKGIIFLTPHLGCYEITSLYYGARYPMAVLYRPPRQAWLLPLIHDGRARGKITLAPANAQGVKQLLQALKRGEAIGILPDQAPLEGEGEWAPFFGRPAYTMTLASKLAERTGAQVLMAFGERLPYGRGYHIHIRPIVAGGINTPALLNAEIERTIAQCPSQYLWMYDRYKVRNQAPPPAPA
ncbi:MAG: lysophospholipid acyltransferase family protein [Methylotenera sp.]|nr:lysophospholipid acyltransferase family protein [Methylotenera sp.]